MSGHVFHPGHQALHGITVVVDTEGGRTYIGRFDKVEEGRMELLNVAVHDPRSATREEFLQRSRKFGVRVELKHLALPESEARWITPLGEPTP